MWRVEVDSFRANPKARELSLTLSAGSQLAIMGPVATGKSSLLKVMGDSVPDGVSVYEVVPITNLRATPQALVKPFGAERATQAMSLLGLWDDRRTSIRELSETKRRSCALLPIAAAMEGLLLIDEHLDVLDPWRLQPFLEDLSLRPGIALAAVTHRPDLAEKLGVLCVLGSRGPLFFGSVDELKTQAGPVECHVATSNSETVQSVAKSLGMFVKRDGNGLLIKLDQGAHEVARLCMSGYAHIESVLVVERTVEESLLTLPQK